jgi:predicted TIM-barrel fold metal-dependent hydrolase
MAVIDLDSHLREHYMLDEVFQLEGEFAKYTPVRIGEGRAQEAKFINKIPSVANIPDRAESTFNHNYMFDPKLNWRGGELAERQAGGYDMERRIRDMDLEGIDHQIVFATEMRIPATAPGKLGAACCRAYNDWVAKLIRGHEDRLWPVGIAPADCPGEWRRPLACM